MLAGRYEEAMEWTDRCLHDRPGYQSAIRGRINCGYLASAAMTIAGYTAFASRFTSAATLAVWVEGFRRAGLPEA